jgi:hypothetical protein
MPPNLRYHCTLVRRTPAILLVGLLAAGCGAAAIDPAVIADTQIAARVKTALVNDAEVGEFPIEVRVVRGVVRLTGRVRAQAQADRAAQLARAVIGVTGLQSDLRVDGMPPAAAPAVPAERAPEPGAGFGETGSSPGLLAIGAAGGWSTPTATALKTRLAFSPLIKIGSPQGLGPALGLDWFQSDLASEDGAVPITRVHIKPVMLGIGYTHAGPRFSVAPSIVGGYAFNSLTVTDTGIARGLPVEVANSLAWRVGVSTWFDLTRRTALNASVGYLMTGLRLTVLEDGRLVERHPRGDTTIVHIGVAYRLF